MARTWTYGDDLPSVTLDRAGNVLGGIPLTVWTAKTGGSQVTDLEVLNAAGEWIDSTVVVTWSTGKQGSFAFRSNTGPEVWIQDPAGYRYHVTAHENLASAVAATASSAQAAAASATAAGTAKDAAETASSTATTAAGTATSARDAAVAARAGAETARDAAAASATLAQQLVGGNTGWVTCTLGAGVLETAPVQVRRIGNVVHIRGQVRRSGAWASGVNHIATLPAGFTPSTYSHAIATMTYDGSPLTTRVVPSGEIQMYAGNATSTAQPIIGGSWPIG